MGKLTKALGYFQNWRHDVEMAAMFFQMLRERRQTDDLPDARWSYAVAAAATVSRDAQALASTNNQEA